MYLFNIDPRDLSPGLVGISVIVQEFIAQHQRDCEQSVLTPRLAFDRRIELLQSVDEKKSQQNHILSNHSS